MARQAGKNELSARAEAALMAAHRHEFRSGIKAAPTKSPQADRSIERLARHLRRCGFRRPVAMAGADYVSLYRSRWWFGSGERDANVVGATADLLLEFDEAQDFDIEKHDKDYRPMAAAAAAATVYYGTASSDWDLLETQRLAALEAERRDGVRRVFDVPWARVAEEVPTYGLFVEAERARLGHTPDKPHPAFLTQYELVPMAGAGRLLTPAQLEALQGDHDRLDGPLSASHNTYVAGLDVGGANLSGADEPDETVLTIARARYPGRGRRADPPAVHIVQQYAWQGLDHELVRREIVRLLRHWRATYVCVDATGIGEPLAGWLLAELGHRSVEPFKFTMASKSSLGFDLLAAINTETVKVWRPDGPDHRALITQARLCRRELTNGKLRWYVDTKDGHDDRLISLALAVRAAQRGRPRVLRERLFEG